MALKDHTNLLLAAALVGAIAAGAYLSREQSEPAKPPPSPTAAATTPGPGETAPAPAPGPGTATGPGTAGPGGEAPPASTVPDDPRIQAAVKAIRDNDRPAARKALESIQPSEPVYAFAQYNLAILYDEQGLYAQARDSFERVLGIDTDNPDVWVGLGWAQYRLDKPLEAERATLRALELEPRHVTARYNLALYRIAHQRLDEAIRSYRRAFELDPGQNGLPAALKDLRAYTEAHPESTAPNFALAMFFHHVNQPVYEVAALKVFLDGAPPGPLRDQARKRLEEAAQEMKAAGLGSENLDSLGKGSGPTGPVPAGASGPGVHPAPGASPK